MDLWHFAHVHARCWREFAKCRFTHFPSLFSVHVDTYMCVCVCVRVCVRACVLARVCGCVLMLKHTPTAGDPLFLLYYAISLMVFCV